MSQKHTYKAMKAMHGHRRTIGMTEAVREALPGAFSRGLITRRAFSICQRYLSGEFMIEIAADLGISRERVRQIITNTSFKILEAQNAK